MALLDMQGMEATRGDKAPEGDDGRSTLSLLSAVCGDSAVSTTVCL